MSAGATFHRIQEGYPDGWPRAVFVDSEGEPTGVRCQPEEAKAIEAGAAALVEVASLRAQVPRVCVVALVVNAAGMVLLVRSAKPGRAWELPGGGMSPGETPIEAAAREVLEEAGVDLDASPLISVMKGRPVAGAMYPSVIYVVTGRAEGAPTAGDDAAAAGWFAPTDLPDDLSDLESLKVLRGWVGNPGAVRS